METLENASQAGIDVGEATGESAIQVAKQKLEEVVTEVKFYAKQLEEAAADKAKKAAVCAIETAKEHPAATVGVIAVLGTLTGFLVARAIYKK